MFTGLCAAKLAEGLGGAAEGHLLLHTLSFSPTPPCTRFFPSITGEVPKGHFHASMAPQTSKSSQITFSRCSRCSPDGVCKPFPPIGIMLKTSFPLNFPPYGHSGTCAPPTSLLSTAEVPQPLVGAIYGLGSAQPPRALVTAPLAAQDTEAGEWSSAGAATL